MSETRLIRRHGAYFRGWAQAFGAHEPASDDKHELRWLLGEEQLGLILTPAIQQGVEALWADDAGGTPATSGAQTNDAAPTALILHAEALQLGGLTLPIASAQKRALEFAADLLADQRDLHLFQTYHLIYPSGTRIMTLSRQAPLALIYRELTPLRLELELDSALKLRPGADAC
jgi:hypothetical protein